MEPKKEVIKKAAETLAPSLYKKFVGLKEIINLIRDEDPDSAEVIEKLIQVIENNSSMQNKREELLIEAKELNATKETFIAKLKSNLDEEKGMISSYLDENKVKGLDDINKSIGELIESINETSKNIKKELDPGKASVFAKKHIKEENKRIKEETEETIVEIRKKFDSVFEAIKEKSDNLQTVIPPIDYDAIATLKKTIENSRDEINNNEKSIHKNEQEIKKIDKEIKKNQGEIKEIIQNFKKETFNYALDQVAKTTEGLKR